MADVDMTDVPSGSSAPAKKAAGKAKAGGDGGADGKKRFEVKKVGDSATSFLACLRSC
jgi:RING-box protein 1